MILHPMIIRPTIFDRFPEILAAQSTREGGVSPEPFGMNLSSHVGDAPENVEENRRRFFESIGALGMRAVYQNQIHSANIHVVSGDEGVVKESDALITGNPGVLLCVSIADCTPVLLYDPVHKVVAGIHAGWRGTEQMIVLSTIRKMQAEFGTRPSDLYAFIGASASKEKYEVGLDVASLFEKQHLTELNPNASEGDRKFLLDVKGANYDQLIYAGLPASQIEVCRRCTISDSSLHSYRRDGKRSGRMLAVIGRLQP